MRPLLSLAPLVTIVAVWLTARTRRHHAERRVRPRPATPRHEVRIICGDCAGDGIVPILTFQTADDRCGRCGGRSYVLKERKTPGAVARPGSFVTPVPMESAVPPSH